MTHKHVMCRFCGRCFHDRKTLYAHHRAEYPNACVARVMYYHGLENGLKWAKEGKT